MAIISKYYLNSSHIAPLGDRNERWEWTRFGWSLFLALESKGGSMYVPLYVTTNIEWRSLSGIIIIGFIKQDISDKMGVWILWDSRNLVRLEALVLMIGYYYESNTQRERKKDSSTIIYSLLMDILCADARHGTIHILRARKLVVFCLLPESFHLHFE